MMLTDLKRGFREGGWFVYVLVLWASLSILTALLDHQFVRAIDWAASLITWLVILVLLGTVHRLRDQLKDCS